MLPAETRLRANKDFRRVYARGRSCVHPMAVLYLLRRKEESAEAAAGCRIGFVVSKKQGDAVVRNRIKRRLREAVRLCLPALSGEPFDLIFVGRGRLRAASWLEVQQGVEELLTRARLLREPAQSTDNS